MDGKILHLDLFCLGANLSLSGMRTGLVKNFSLKIWLG